MERDLARGRLFGLGAAALFGASAPVAKLLLPGSSPLAMAALLYLGAGVAMALVRAAARERAWFRAETPLRRADAGILAAMAVLGGIAGPVLMLVGLARTSGVAGALLLNLQAPLTMALAALFFREHVGRRAAAAGAVVTAGALLLAWRPGEVRADWVGVAALAGACACWALDDNLSQRLSLRDPTAVVLVKALGAGACTLALALASGARFPAPAGVGAALALGAASYGGSLLLDLRALALVGAAREAAMFATAPFFGAVLAIPLLRERPGIIEALAAGAMAAGVALLARERHAHRHVHEPLAHDHLHTHDEHHRHVHAAGEDAGGPHAHPHEHEPLAHEHPHAPDLHHRHRHD